MSLSPLLSASPVIQIHAFAAIFAFVLGAVVLFRRKGDRPHKRLGTIWVALMGVVAVSSFFIWTIRLFGPFSPIHLLSIVTLAGLWKAIAFARRRNIKGHMRTMQMLYLGALIIAGWFTFMPGRIMNHVVFGPDGAGPMQSAVFLAVSLAVFAGAIWLVRRSGGLKRKRRVAAE